MALPPTLISVHRVVVARLMHPANVVLRWEIGAEETVVTRAASVHPAA